MRTLISEASIQGRLREIAAELNTTYQDSHRLVVVGVLKGSFMVLADLVRHLEVPCQIEMIRLASYSGQNSTGKVKPVDLSLPSLKDADVLIVEDIVDTGLTMKFLLEYLRAMHQTRSLKLMALLDKPEARLPEAKAAFSIDWTGFSIGNEFVVGYGLDYEGLYRNLPFIAVMEPEDLPVIELVAEGEA